MRVAVISTYPPRACGIGTFSADLRSALLEADGSIDVDVVSIVRDSPRDDRPEVVGTIRQDVRSDYPSVARTLTSRGTDVVLIEHEFGIFGGEEGAFLLSLVDCLHEPLVITLHTVLSEPSVLQARTLRALCERAALVTVFTETARRMVIEAQLVVPERVRVVPHGAPTVLLPSDSAGEGAPARIAHRHPDIERLAGRTVLATFGLISAGKGIETAIAALPAILAKHPTACYVVAGQTHPEVIKSEGERYRLSLERLTRDLGLAEHVQFLDRFLTVEDMAELLAETDVFVTPYRSRDQIVSGALTYAVVAGCPVVSTPYLYAEDLLAGGAGVLVAFDDPDALAAGVAHLLDDPGVLQRARDEARRVGAELTWPAVGMQTLHVLREAVDIGPVAGSVESAPTASLPSIRPDHLLTLVDDVGIVQHADGLVPNRASGYCVDDVARLAIVALGLHRDRPDAAYRRMLTLALSFLHHAWDPTIPGMHNLMAYDRRWLDQPHVGDHVGRAVWALGEVVAAHPPTLVAGPSVDLLREMVPALGSDPTPRAAAFALLGLARPAPRLLPQVLYEPLRTLADHLAARYAGSADRDWQWFEDSLTYDNARLAQALIVAGARLDEPNLLAIGLQALDWYIEQCVLDSGVVRLVGNRWRARDRNAWAERPDSPAAVEGDEQPMDAAALVEACVEALTASGDRKYGRIATAVFEWFFGRNRLGIAVYDFASGGCHDGLGETINDNEGAESTLAFLQALLALERAGLQRPLGDR